MIYHRDHVPGERKGCWAQASRCTMREDGEDVYAVSLECDFLSLSPVLFRLGGKRQWVVPSLDMTMTLVQLLRVRPSSSSQRDDPYSMRHVRGGRRPWHFPTWCLTKFASHHIQRSRCAITSGRSRTFEQSYLSGRVGTACLWRGAGGLITWQGMWGETEQSHTPFVFPPPFMRL